MKQALFQLMLLVTSAFLLTASGNEPVLVPAGAVLRSELEETVRITSGARVSAKLTEPLYVGDKLVARQGCVVRGGITSVHAVSFSKRQRRLLSGDFTTPKIAHVTFDQLVLPDGKIQPISTSASIGFGDVRKALYSTTKPRRSMKQAFSAATRPITEPKKLQRLGRAAITALPYHPEYLGEGAVFDTTLLGSFKAMPVSLTESEQSRGSGLLHTRLVTPLDSASNSARQPVKAVVVRPYYAADGTLLFPAGTALDGEVSRALPSGKWKKHGTLRFEFRTIAAPGRDPVPLSATVAGVEASHPHTLAVDEEGDITARNSRAGQVFALTSLVGPSIGAANSRTNKTVFARATEGVQAFGLVGGVAAQASSSTTVGFGFFGAAVDIYDRILAHGADIQLPENTRVLLRLSQ